MLEITNIRHGAILNHNHGKETDSALSVLLEGFCSGRPVKVNGEPAQMEGRRFYKEVLLTEKINSITVSEMTSFGLYSREITVVWDKKSYKRFNFYIDDHSFLFTDLARERPKSAFDHFYLKGLKNIHDKYGFKVTLNSFYYNDHDKSFTLDMMPDTWKQEFIDNSHWLKFSFHARSEFPDRLYLESNPEEFGKDWDMVQNEIIRFAGEASYIPPVVIHWGNIHPTVAQECVKRGVKCYPSFMRPCVMGGPSLADRTGGGDMNKVQNRSMTGADRAIGTEGFALFYKDQEMESYLRTNRNYYDPLMGIFITGPGAVCSNLTPLDKTEEKVKNNISINEKNGCEVMNMASHEQYTYPYYPNYLPDHLQRIELAVKTAVEAGYTGTFYAEGLLGNCIWDK